MSDLLPPGLAEAFPDGFKFSLNESELKALDVINATLLSRQELVKRMMDPRRDINAECGFPDPVTIQHYKEMWDREAVAARVVQCFSQESWQVQPGVYEDEDPEAETEFEIAWDELGKSLRGEESWFKDEQGSPIWSLLARADELSGIGTFGVILLGFADGEDDLSQPLKRGKGGKLLYASTFDESLVQIVRFNNDKKSRNYGKPDGYSIQLADLNDSDHIGASLGSVGVRTTTLNVHASRVIHLADTHHTASASETFAIPRMKAVFNNLLGLRKLYAGSPEMYWKGAFPGYSWESHPSLGSDVKINRTKFRDQMEQFMNGLQRYTANIGGSLKTLSPMVVDPTQQINVQIDAICIKLGVPRQVFIGAGSQGIGSGKETESLTGTWNGRLKARQQNYVTPKVIVPLVDRLIWAGVLPEPEEYHVEWPDLEVPAPASKAQVALTITQALVAYVSGGLENLMTPADYLTRVCGFEDEVVESILENTQEHLESIAPDTPDEEYIPGHVPSEEEPEFDEEQFAGLEEEGNPKKPKPGEPVSNALTDNVGSNCGITSGGFAPGNTCAKGGSLGPKGTPPRKKTPAIGYHSTEIDNLNGIAKNGLIPQVSSTGGGGGSVKDKAIYFADDIAGTSHEHAPENKHEAEFQLRVKIPKGHKAYDDSEVREYSALSSDPNSQIGKDSAFLTTKNIPPKNIEVLVSKKGPRKWLAISEYIKTDDFKRRKEEHGFEDYVVNNLIDNVFCKTGANGGVDPTCSPKRGGTGIPSIYKKKSGDTLHAATYDAKAKTYKYADGTIPKAVKSGAVYIPPTWKNVYVNPDPDGNLLAEGQDEKGKFQPRYGKTHNVKTAAAKFGNVSELRAKQDKIKAEMIKDSKNPIHKENADALRLIQHTGIRPGGNQTDAEHQSYGAVTLEGRHVKTIKGKTVLRFVPGKSHGKEKTFEVRDPDIAKMLQERAKLSGSTGKLFNTDSKSLATYSKSKDGGSFKAKDHRTVLGTDTAVAILDGMKRAKDVKSYKKAVYEVADRVADTLGNTRKVALKHYIDPTVWSRIQPRGVDWNPAD